ncbi:MAG: hypothetical protein A2X86_14955 [Bdellovibrionales bacterium GWA2_49_15]|nr:MAG: hypothetical protein A2X86_14955 [Bdellovibrionales bacterium GWA2_49_15]HAZ13358.1 hypothetical protein [Bdellovibrionales bacterium]
MGSSNPEKLGTYFISEISPIALRRKWVLPVKLIIRWFQEITKLFFMSETEPQERRATSVHKDCPAAGSGGKKRGDHCPIT